MDMPMAKVRPSRAVALGPTGALGVALPFLALFVLGVTLPLFGGGYWGVIATRACVYWVLVSGLNLVVGFAGQLAIGWVSLLTLGAYTTSVLAAGNATPELPPYLALAIAGVVGAALGSYGIAAAASGSGSTSTATTSSTAAPAAAPAQAQPPAQSPPGANAQNPWGNQRSDETLLTGDTATKVKQLALAKVGSGATVVRVETDADGHAAYEAHMVKADGTPVTVYVDKSFAVVGVETRP